MKFARFEYQGKECYGVLQEETFRVLSGPFLEGSTETGAVYPLSGVRFLPPVIPSKVVCIGLNYIGHIQEVGEATPAEPLFFFKPPSCLIGHKDYIVYPRPAQKVGYEAELALIINRKMKEVSPEEAYDYVFGCSCFNDVTERRLSKTDALLSQAKGFDTFGPLGPYVVTGLNPDKLEIKGFLNGKLKQHDNTQACVFKVGQILSYISHRITLYPGDVVTTGTPKGIDLMGPGDVSEVEVEGIGTLTNPVKAADRV